MLTIYHINPDHKLAVALALTAVIDTGALSAFEAVCPVDARPRYALMTAMKWLQGEAAEEECLNATSNAYQAYQFICSLPEMPSTVAGAAYAIYVIVYLCVNPSAALSAVETSTIYALGFHHKNKTTNDYIDNLLLRLLPLILEYKIANNQNFNQLSKMVESLSQPDQDKFLSHLKTLVADFNW